MFNAGDDQQWMQFYLQQTESQGDPALASNHPGESEFFDSAIDPGIISKSGQMPLSNPPGSGSGSGPSPKPIRRRSRASKKTPITVLQANANNFRTLVQQFTGCPGTAISFKGPLNLSFSNFHPQNHAAPNNNHPYNSSSNSSSSSSAPVLVPSSYGHGQRPQRGRSLFPFGNSAATASASAGVFIPGQSSMGLETAMSLDQGFAAAIDSNTSVQGLPANPNSLSW